MKNKDLFDKTVGILVAAYLNNTLIHGSCNACAVGNIITANNGWAGSEAGGYNWFDYAHKLDMRENHWGRQRALDQIASTGYSLKEILKIEKAFENADSMQEDQRIFKGLMAVVDALCEIHEANQQAKQEAKTLFVK